MYNTVEVVVGTYGRYLLGYKCADSAKDKKIILTQSFATKSHAAAIRCVATYGKYLASGGADNRIFIYDMKLRKEIQILKHHTGVVNALAFATEGSHILTGSDDTQLCAVHLNTWKVEGAWKKGSAVTSIGCHPSGKLALILGSDSMLCTWSLVKGKMAYSKSNKSFGGQPDCVSWSQDGEHFALSGLRMVEIWNTQTCNVKRCLKCDSKPTSLCWLSEYYLVVSLEDGKLLLLNIDEKKITSFQAHTQAVKDIAFTNQILATACSSGEITLWTIDLINKSLKEVCSTNIGYKPNCITLIDLTQFGDESILKKEKINEEKSSMDNSFNSRCSNSKASQVTVRVEVEDEANDEILDSPSKQSETPVIYPKLKNQTEVKKIIESKNNNKEVDEADKESLKNKKRKFDAISNIEGNSDYINHSNQISFHNPSKRRKNKSFKKLKKSARGIKQPDFTRNIETKSDYINHSNQISFDNPSRRRKNKSLKKLKKSARGIKPFIRMFTGTKKLYQRE